jgi:hypothetical protein
MREMKLRMGIVFLTVAIVLSFVLNVVWADPQKILSTIDANSGNCKAVSQKIFDFK